MTKRTKRLIMIAVSFILSLTLGLSLKQNRGKQLVDPKEHSKVEKNSKAEPKVIEEKEDEVELSSSKAEDPEEVEEEPEEITEEETPVQNEEELATSEPENVEIEESKPKQKQEEIPAEEPEIVEPKREVVPSSSLGMTEYLLPNANSEERVENTTHVMLHFTSNALNNPTNPYLIEDTYNIFRDYGVSAHYVIGRDGEIYLFVPENRVAYHAGRGYLSGFPEYMDHLNHYSIGIELLGIGTREEMIPIITAEKFDQIDPSIIGFTEAQYQSLNTLLNDIVGRHPHIHKNREHIVGHDEYSDSKTDPGSLFNWSKIGL